MVAACPFPSPQGSQVFLGQMCSRLAARGHEVHLLTYGQGMGGCDPRVVHHRIRRLPGDDALRSGPQWAKPALDALLTAALLQLVRTVRPDLVHCHNYEAAVVGLVARSRSRVPLLYHSHNLMGDELVTYFQGSLTRAAATVVGRLADATVPRYADHTIALCEYTYAALLRRRVPRERLSLIPAAVEDLGHASPTSTARGRLGLAQQGLLIGYCGNLDPYQNLPFLLDALAILRHESAAGCSPARALIATHRVDAALMNAIGERDLSSLTTVRLVADFEEACLAMAAADVVVLPRRRGSGYPIKLLNYMSLGRAIVSAGCGAKVLRHGVDGLIVPDDDPQALAAAVRRLGQHAELRSQLGKAARAAFLASYTWDAVLPVIESVYEKVSRPRGSGSVVSAL